MGHHSCCNQQKVKRGLWSPEEDEKLIRYITTHGYGCWSEEATESLFMKELKRRGMTPNSLLEDAKKSNYGLDEDIKGEGLEAIICCMHGAHIKLASFNRGTSIRRLSTQDLDKKIVQDKKENACGGGGGSFRACLVLLVLVFVAMSIMAKMHVDTHK